MSNKHKVQYKPGMEVAGDFRRVVEPVKTLLWWSTDGSCGESTDGYHDLRELYKDLLMAASEDTAELFRVTLAEAQGFEKLREAPLDALIDTAKFSVVEGTGGAKVLDILIEDLPRLSIPNVHLPVGQDDRESISKFLMGSCECIKPVAGGDLSNVANAKIWPWSCIGAVTASFSKPTGGVRQSHGSGTLIGPRHVLTAAHCVVESGGIWGDNITFTVDHSIDDSSDNPLRSAGVAAVMAVDGYLNDSSPVGGDYDYALIILDRDVGRYAGWVGLGMPAPERDIVESTDYKPYVLVSGYPVDTEKNAEHDGTLQVMHWSYASALNRERLVFKADCGMGQSGCGVMTLVNGKLAVLGVHHEGTDVENYAVALNEDVFNNYVEWLEAW